MKTNTTKQFKHKVYKQALLEMNTLFDSRGERVKGFAQFFFLIVLVILIVLIWVGAPVKFLLEGIITNALLLIGSFVYPVVFAYFKRWKYAAQMHNEMGGFDTPNLSLDVKKTINEMCRVTIQITNESKYPIKDCFFKIIKIEPPINTYLSNDVFLEWADHFSGKEKIEIGINNGQQIYIANAVVASWIGNEEERNMFVFTTEDPYKEHKYVGSPQKYKVILEFNGTYLWNEFKHLEIVEIEPNIGESLITSNINIRKIEQ